MTMDPVILSDEEKALSLDVGEIVLRRLILSGKKDCTWCELHLKCNFEHRNYHIGFYCSLWELSKKLRENLKITLEEFPS